MTDDQIREEFDSLALWLKDPDVIGDFGRLRELVMNEIAIRQAALEKIAGLKRQYAVGQTTGERAREIARRFTGGK